MTQTSQEPDRFALADLAGHPLPDGSVIARNRHSGRQMTLPGEVWNAISYCDSFRTMDEHVAFLAAGNPGARGREGEIRQILQSVLDGGLMLSAQGICRELEPVAASPVAELPVLAVITCDRPRALARLLESMAAECDLERVHRGYVIDDSRHAQSQSRNRRIVEDANRDLEARGLRGFRYFGANEAARLLDALIGRLPEREAGIRFLLEREGRTEHVTTGISRNFSLLLSAGRPLVVFDDDVVCRVMDPPEAQDGVEFSKRQRDCRFYESEASWPAGRRGNGRCPVRGLMRALGLPLRASLAALGSPRPLPSSFEYAEPGFARRLEENGRVLFTQCGSYGDPGTSGNQWLATMPRESRARLFELAGGIEAALRHRNCWLGRSRPVFEPRANMSQLAGIDNRAYLPPYFPLFRGQDRKFGVMSEFVHPHSLSLDLPFALPHLPIPQRAWREGDDDFSLPFTLAQFQNDFLTGQIRNCGARDPLMRNGWLAMLFSDLGDRPLDDLLEMAGEHWMGLQIDQVTKLGNALEDSQGAPRAWIEYLQDAVAQTRASAVADFRTAELRGSPAQLRGNELLDYWRAAWRDFGAGIRAWPAVREAMDQVPN